MDFDPALVPPPSPSPDVPMPPDDESPPVFLTPDLGCGSPPRKRRRGPRLPPPLLSDPISPAAQPPKLPGLTDRLPPALIDHSPTSTEETTECPL